MKENEGVIACNPGLSTLEESEEKFRYVRLARLRGDLLEQPPSLLSSGALCHRRDPVGQFEPVVLAVADIGRDFEGKVLPVLYVAGILLAFIHPRIACSTHLLVALLWLVPDRRMKEWPAAFI
jgi:hypothetical protein